MELNDVFGLKDKVAMITGAASGIGKHFAITLAKAGCEVILLDKNDEKLSVTESLCKKYGVGVLSICVDVTALSQIKRAIETAKRHFSYINILINSAGVGGVHVDVLTLTEAQWDNVIDVNLKSTFFMSQAAASWMIESKVQGKIINISSAAAYHTTKIRSVYSISKIGVESLTRNFALSLSDYDINVNCIAPGFVETELTEDYLKTDSAKNELKQIPMQRAAKLVELEGVLFLLASSASNYMSGTTIRIDGGCAINKV